MEVKHLTENKVGFFSCLVVYLIIFYQKVISPAKGFSCAHCYENGGLSCSEYAKRVVQKKGITSAFNDIQSRFDACKQAAIKIQNRCREAEAGFLDCSLDGCSPDGCFDGVGGSGAASGPSIVIVLPIGILLILLIIGGSALYKAPQVDSIDIRLIKGRQEVQEKGVARLLGGKQPDYQVAFTVNGRKIVTNTLKNSSAKAWLSLQPEAGFRIKDIESFSIVNKQVLRDEVLEVIDRPSERGRGEIYEYRIGEGWGIF